MKKTAEELHEAKGGPPEKAEAHEKAGDHHVIGLISQAAVPVPLRRRLLVSHLLVGLPIGLNKSD